MMFYRDIGNLTKDGKIRRVYVNNPVWLFYWWKFESKYKDNLKEFRKTISDKEHTFGRERSSTPMVEIGKMIDRYKTWKD